MTNFQKESKIRYQPKIIKTEAENEAALKVVEQLMHSDTRTPEEDELYALLIILIEKFEREYYQPGEKSNPHSILNFLIEQKGIEKKDLVEIIGSEELLAEIIDKQKEINKAQAKALGKYFHVDASLFV